MGSKLETGVTATAGTGTGSRGARRVPPGEPRVPGARRRGDACRLQRRRSGPLRPQGGAGDSDPRHPHHHARPRRRRRRGEGHALRRRRDPGRRGARPAFRRAARRAGMEARQGEPGRRERVREGRRLCGLGKGADQPISPRRPRGRQGVHGGASSSTWTPASFRPTWNRRPCAGAENPAGPPRASRCWCSRAVNGPAARATAIYARLFSKPGSSVYLSVSCPDAATLAAARSEAEARIAVVPPSA